MAPLVQVRHEGAETGPGVGDVEILRLTQETRRAPEVQRHGENTVSFDFPARRAMPLVSRVRISSVMKVLSKYSLPSVS